MSDSTCYQAQVPLGAATWFKQWLHETPSGWMDEWVAEKARAGCEVCFGKGWVCEQHPMSPWQTDTPGACGCWAKDPHKVYTDKRGYRRLYGEVLGRPCVCTGLDDREWYHLDTNVSIQRLRRYSDWIKVGLTEEGSGHSAEIKIGWKE